MRVVTVGGSVAGLATAALLAEAGHQVVVLDRAAQPPASSEATADWHRPTVPQARHSHAFASAGSAVIRDRFPLAAARLQEAGVGEVGLADPPPPSLRPFTGDAGDDDLTMLLSRRNVLEWALHRDTVSRSGVETRYRTKAVGLTVEAGRVTGVVLESGEELACDLVVDAAGRRSPVPGWLTEAGVKVPTGETTSAGITYYTRHYRRTGGRPGGPLNRGFGAGGLWDSYTAVLFLGDGDTFTISVGVSPQDEAFKGLREGPAFTALVAATALLAGWLDPEVSEPTSEVVVMAGLTNSWTPVSDGEADGVVGVLPVGDAMCTTNPAYGRGVSLALTHAVRVADRLGSADRLDDATFAALLADATEHYRPWYEEAVANDHARTAMWAAAAAGGPPGPGGPADPQAPLPFGLIAATAATDEYVWRRLVRTMMLLDHPQPLYRDPQVKQSVGRVLAAAGSPPPVTGATRSRAIAAVTATAPARELAHAD